MVNSLLPKEYGYALSLCSVLIKDRSEHLRIHHHFNDSGFIPMLLAPKAVEKNDLDAAFHPRSNFRSYRLLPRAAFAPVEMACFDNSTEGTRDLRPLKPYLKYQSPPKECGLSTVGSSYVERCNRTRCILTT